MASYPTFTGGVTAHLPFGQTSEFVNVHNDMPHGWRYAFNLRATALKSWSIEYVLSDADLTTLRAFWDARAGRYEEFEFTDPDTTVTHTKCRFDMEELAVEYIQPNENRVRVLIREYA